MWAMGITHHEHGVDNVLAIANLALARGMVGRPHAGLMPIRGHSNVQGIGSVGFTPELKSGFLKAMEEFYGLKPPREKGLDSMNSVHAAHRGEMDFALLMGGNFYAANPDTHYSSEAFSQITTLVHINTKLNQGHVNVTPVRQGAEVFILPTCVRDEEASIDNAGKPLQFCAAVERRHEAAVKGIEVGGGDHHQHRRTPSSPGRADRFSKDA